MPVAVVVVRFAHNLLFAPCFHWYIAQAARWVSELVDRKGVGVGGPHVPDEECIPELSVFS